MPRRVYTNPCGMGWTGSNFIETIGSYITAVGLLMVAGNLVTSLFRGAPAGNDPFEGDTLEWATTSPPPAYNFAVVPKVSSPYAMWDREDRQADVENLARGEVTLQGGHHTAASTVVDAEWDEVLDMPSDSWAPLLVAAATTGIFAMLLTGHLLAAAVFAALVAAAVAGWHLREPQHA